MQCLTAEVILSHSLKEIEIDRQLKEETKSVKIIFNIGDTEYKIANYIR